MVPRLAGGLLTLLLLLLAEALPEASRPSGRGADLHLLRRTSFSITPDDLQRLRLLGPRGWLADQLHPGPEPALEERLRTFVHYGATPREVLITEYENRYDVNAEGLREEDDVYTWERLVDRQLMLAVDSRYGLREGLVDFWFNHFNVCWGLDIVASCSLPDYVEGAVRPHALGRFRDLLGATARHPAMLIFLDNWRSDAHSDGGLNENFARELLELHTVGVGAGYTQEDVRQVALCFTGWTLVERGVGDPRQVPGSLEFRFDPAMHDGSAHELPFLGEVIPAGGVEQGERVLDLLARHPATARRISEKLAIRYVADSPPPELVDRMAATWGRTDGDLAAVMETLLTSPEFYRPEYRGNKLKTPFEMVAGTLRALGAPVNPGVTGALGPSRAGDIPPAEALERLAAPLFQCLSPRGYPDVAAEWQHPGGLLQRYRSTAALARRFAPALAEREGLRDAEALAARLQPWALSPGTLDLAASGAFDPAAVAAAVLASPEFQHR